MTLETFSPSINPSIGMTKKRVMKTLEAQFGDGYTQAAADGINSVRFECSLTWEVLNTAQADYITSFLDSHKGATPFLWTIPGEASPLKWTCGDYTETFRAGEFRSITATFKQSFNLVT